MGVKGISGRVTQELHSGKSREEIFQLLSGEMPGQQDRIAYTIASVPNEVLRKRYLYLNILLFLLLIGAGALALMSSFPSEDEGLSFFLLVTTIVPLVIAYFVLRFYGGIYKVCAVWFLVDLAETFFFTGFADNVSLIKLFFSFLIVLISFFIAHRVFPQLGFLGPNKKIDGTYMLGED